MQRDCLSREGENDTERTRELEAIKDKVDELNTGVMEENMDGDDILEALESISTGINELLED